MILKETPYNCATCDLEKTIDMPFDASMNEWCPIGHSQKQRLLEYTLEKGCPFNKWRARP